MNNRTALTTATMTDQTTITEYKKQGHFDAQRRELFDMFVADGARQQELNELLRQLVKHKIEKDPDFYGKNRGKMAALIQTELVKRHVVKEQSKARGERGSRSASVAGPGVSTYSETGLLDDINGLLDGFAVDVEKNGALQCKIKAQLKG